MTIQYNPLVDRILYTRRYLKKCVFIRPFDTEDGTQFTLTTT